MSPIQRFRTAISVFAAMVAVAVVAPVAAQAPDPDQALVAAPAAPSWDETSGYSSVEASRAVIGTASVVSGQGATGHEASAAIGPSWDETSGYGAVETSRVAADESETP